jgi:hypothetical protein
MSDLPLEILSKEEVQAYYIGMIKIRNKTISQKDEMIIRIY